MISKTLYSSTPERFGQCPHRPKYYYLGLFQQQYYHLQCSQWIHPAYHLQNQIQEYDHHDFHSHRGK